jgi:hypothetical protein
MIDSVENKAKLWNTCMERNMFANIPQNMVQNVQKKFEESVSLFVNQSTSTNDIEFINNQILKHFNDELLSFNSTDKETMKNDRKSEFEKRLQEKQNEFNSIMKKPNPETIDFSHEPDEPIKENIDELIKKHTEERNAELNKVFSKQLPDTQIERNNTVIRSVNIENTSPMEIRPPNQYNELENSMKILLESNEKLKMVVNHQNTMIQQMVNVQLQILSVLKEKL